MRSLATPYKTKWKDTAGQETEEFEPTVPEKEAKEIGCQPLLYVFIII